MLELLQGFHRNPSSSENLLLSWNKSVIARCASRVTRELSDKPPLTCRVPDLVIHTPTPLPLNSRCCPQLPRKTHEAFQQFTAHSIFAIVKEDLGSGPGSTHHWCFLRVTLCRTVETAPWWNAALAYLSSQVHSLVGKKKKEKEWTSRNIPPSVQPWLSSIPVIEDTNKAHNQRSLGNRI